MKLDSKYIFFLLKKESHKCSYIACLTLIILLIFHLSNKTIKLDEISRATTLDRNNGCDLFKGRWVRDARGPLYTNHSCRTIPANKNCLSNGRNDTGFLHWRWKPNACELPRFAPEKFLASLQGKTIAFIGDSLARNQMESLLCLLSTVETPKQTRKDAENRFATWEFPNKNFTLMALWSQFLVSSAERFVNGSATGSFDIHLDRVDPAWSERLPTIDYAVFSDTPWFISENYLYEGGRLVGCTYCRAPEVPSLDPTVAVGRAFRTAFRAVNRNRTFSLLRTYSHSHFENGTWNSGGVCDRTGPTGTGGEDVETGGVDCMYRKTQVEEAERERRRLRVVVRGIVLRAVIDVTRMMSVRKDGHPGVHWKVNWMDGYRDCVHWCLPGPIHVWNELLFELIKREARASTSEN